MQAVRLASSVITHTRHGKPSHFLSRSGLSIFIDLDKLMIANSQSSLFSVDKFNLISGLHSYFSKKNSKFKNLLPPLILLKPKEMEELINDLNNLKFEINKNLAA